MSEGGKGSVRVDDVVVGAREVRRLEERARELVRLLGRKTTEVEILHEAIDPLAGKRVISLSDPARGDSSR